MEQFAMTFTSNTGLLVQYGDTKVLFDSLYGKSDFYYISRTHSYQQVIVSVRFHSFWNGRLWQERGTFPT